MKPIHGKIMMATGVLHSVIVGLILYWENWSEFARRFFFSVSPRDLHAEGALAAAIVDTQAESAIWFFVTGVVLFVLGQVVHGIEVRDGGRAPAYVGWELLAIAIIFSWMIPISGFPIVLLPQAIYMVVRQSKLAGIRQWQKQT